MDALRTAVLVELLAGNPDARRATVSWSLVPRRLRDAAMVSAWSKCSGLPRSQLELVAEMLLQHKVCLPDRTVDPEALRIIQHLAAETLRKRRE